ncbi:cobyrinic acid a,c-diamide synthase [Amorphus sp. MBR-141]
MWSAWGSAVSADVAETVGLVIAAPSSGSGKTVTTLGLAAALRARGLRVGVAKAGPDYIDARFHDAVSVRPAPNLDLWAMRPDLVTSIAADAAAGSDVLLVEGVMGLFDGPVAGPGSTADLARHLDLPVVLVVDASRQSASVAALVHGFTSFDPTVDVCGVILTRVASDRHEAMLRGALEAAGQLCLGCVRTDPALVLPSRHLGLVQAGEHPDLAAFAEAAGRAVAAGVDLDALLMTAAAPPEAARHPTLPPLGQRIAVARDAAFAFAYPHLLSGWQAQGAEIRTFSPLADEAPDPGADAVFLPGGYPELHAGRLAAAGRFHQGLRAHAAAGHLVYGECGGFMVLGRGLVDADGVEHAMAGLLDHVTSFAERRRSLGYRSARHASPLPWPADLRGHEFHYSAQTHPPSGSPLYEVADAAGARLPAAGAVRGTVCGSYLHILDGR